MGSSNEKADSKFYLGLILLIIIGLLATLPFHYVFHNNEVKFFAKDNFTFKDTFVTDADIDKLIERHNNANFWERSAITNESIYKKLVAEGIIIKSESKEEE